MRDRYAWKTSYTQPECFYMQQPLDKSPCTINDVVYLKTDLQFGFRKCVFFNTN